MSSPFVKSYAKALFQNLKKSKNKNESYSSFAIEKITSLEQKKVFSNILIAGEELELLRAVLISSKKLNSLFKNPTYAESQKVDILLTLFPGLTSTVKSFLKVLTERSHLFLLPEISDEFTTILLKVKNTIKINVTVASQFDEKTGNPLLKNLKKIANSIDIILTTSYNSQLLGGLIVEYNSVAVDASTLQEFSLLLND
jgi:ATP synthase F1 delta subunit